MVFRLQLYSRTNHIPDIFLQNSLFWVQFILGWAFRMDWIPEQAFCCWKEILQCSCSSFSSWHCIHFQWIWKQVNIYFGESFRLPLCLGSINIPNCTFWYLGQVKVQFVYNVCWSWLTSAPREHELAEYKFSHFRIFLLRPDSFWMPPARNSV